MEFWESLLVAGSLDLHGSKRQIDCRAGCFLDTNTTVFAEHDGFRRLASNSRIVFAGGDFPRSFLESSSRLAGEVSSS